jgi:hypothetical protein
MLKQLLYYFEGLDDSVLKLNDLITNKGFEFIKCTLKDFERKYKRKFTALISVNHPLDFWGGLSQLRCFNKDILKDGYIIFLDDKHKNYLEDELDDRVKKLIENFKLFKSGHVKLVSAFEFPFPSESEFFGPIIYSALSANGYKRYSVESIDNSLELLKIFKEQIEIPAYLTLAFNSFLDYYNVEDYKVKLIMLMICLESIFNVNKENITETLSRHVALTITRDKNEFDEIVKKVKFLYDLRSWIVHGKDKNKNDKNHRKHKKSVEEIKIHVLELEELVRSVLQQLIWIHKYIPESPKNQEELFSILSQSSPLEYPSPN